MYLADGAVPAHAICSDGRHRAPGDEAHWHLYPADAAGQVAACFRLAKHPPGARAEDLSCHGCVDRMGVGGRGRYAAALAAGVAAAAAAGLAVGEVGGWAVRPDARRSRASHLLPLSAWALYRIIGHSLVLSAATHRHRSADILKTLGGSPLSDGASALPCFLDPYHGCEMEFVVYDSRRPNPEYAATVGLIHDRLRATCPWQDWLGDPAGG